MFLKAVIAFLVLPGTFGFALPMMIGYFDPWKNSGSIFGFFFILLGTLILLICIKDFYIAGKGTLAPWSPPQHLVQIGLYQYSRNPMYLGVLCLTSGLALYIGSLLILIYTIMLGLGFHIRVVSYEEPILAKQFNSEWQDYTQRVRRWLAKPF